MRWGISTLLIDDLDIVSNLHLLKDLEIDHVEIRAEYHHFYYDDDGYVDSLQSVLKKTGLRAYSLHMPIRNVDISDPNGDDRLRSVNEIKKAGRALTKLKGEIVVVHPGGKIKDGFLREDLICRSVESLRELDSYFSACGLKMALENTLPDRIGSGIEELWWIYNQLNSDNSGICLDTGHISMKEDAIPALKRFKDHLIHLHIADNLGKNDDHFLPGEGKIDWDIFINVLKEIDYQGVFMLEIKKEGSVTEMIQRIKSAREGIKL